jgi:hypothetical protein
MFERSSPNQTDFDLVFGLSKEREAVGPVDVSLCWIEFNGTRPLDTLGFPAIVIGRC